MKNILLISIQPFEGDATTFRVAVNGQEYTFTATVDITDVQGKKLHVFGVAHEFHQLIGFDGDIGLRMYQIVADKYYGMDYRVPFTLGDLERFEKYQELGDRPVESVQSMFDPDEQVRVAAAMVLGQRSSLPDQALLYALHDHAKDVRIAAFRSLLELLRLPYRKIEHEVVRLNAGESQPTLGEIKRIINREKLDVPEDFLKL